MRKLIHSRRVWVILLVLSLFACVTINIYFPAEKVESVASEIVQDIRGGQPGNKASTEDTPQSAIFDFRQIFGAASVAWAQDAVNVSNPAIRALKAQMKQRYGQLKPFYANGSLVEKDDGYVAEGNVDPLGLKERRTLKGLIDAENRDRAKLYQEVAAALSIDPSQTSRIGEIFSAEWKKSVR
jgi:hypothetical protein